MTFVVLAMQMICNSDRFNQASIKSNLDSDAHNYDDVLAETTHATVSKKDIVVLF